MRSLYNALVIRVNTSGSHSVGPDLILFAYERSGVEKRPKDISLFFYYLTVSDTLSVDTKYGKKQRELKENRRDKAKCLRGKTNFNDESFTCY